MTDNNKLRDTIMDMEASLSTNLSGYSMWHYGADIHGITRETLKNAIEALKAQEPVSPNKEQHQCNKCEFYQGVHNVMGHAPRSFWDIGGVMWDDYCSHFSHDENDLGTCRATLHKDAITLSKAQEPVVHGRWYDKGSLSCRCSCCGCKSDKEYNYCPNCGAKNVEG